MTIDPGVVTLIQTTFLEHLNSTFSTVARYALNLLYLFAALELAVFGLVWALKRDVGLDKLLFKIIKIGLVFFVIRNYTWLMDTILQSFAQLAGIVIRDNSIKQYIFNPAKIWQYGYNVWVHLLELATSSDVFGLTMIQISLGMGILLIFGLLGIQMVVQMVSFYLVSFAALILLPFGAFTAGRKMFDQAVQSVLQAGLRLMVVTMIIGIAVVIWNGFQFVDLATTTNFNLNQPLGLFFTALLFLCLALYVPKVVSQTVGDLSSNLLDGSTTVVATPQAAAAVSIAAGSTGMSNMLAATTLAPDSSPGAVTSYDSASSAGAATVVPTTTSSNLSTDAGARMTLAEASSLSKSISGQTVKKIKESMMQGMKNKTIDS